MLLDRALEHADKQLVRDPETGSKLPLNMPVENFSIFGAAVTAYMHFVHRAAHLFFLCFLLSISNIIANLEGCAQLATREQPGLRTTPAAVSSNPSCRCLL